MSPKPGCRGEGRSGFRPRFFVDASEVGFADLPSPEAREGGELILSPEDTHHARNVLRSRVGDPVEVVIQPWGLVVLGTILRVGNEVRVRVEEVCPPDEPDRIRIMLVQALAEFRHLDDVVEKATEVGVSHFLFLPADDTKATALKMRDRISRWRRIAREAAKQSKQSSIPRVEVADSLAGAFSVVQGDGWTSIAFEPSGAQSLRPAMVAAQPRGRLALWVGPENGWPEEALAFFAEHEVQLVGLGRRILRSETAGMIVGALAHFAAGDW